MDRIPRIVQMGHSASRLRLAHPSCSLSHCNALDEHAQVPGAVKSMACGHRPQHVEHIAHAHGGYLAKEGGLAIEFASCMCMFSN